MDRISELNYWEVRSEEYNNLEWVEDNSYMNNLINYLDLKEYHSVLEVGAGTGVISNNIKDKVASVVALDISSHMLNKGIWEGVSLIEWDIRKSLFDKLIFDRIVARMVFHHILLDIEDAFAKCYNYLKNEGKIVIAEAVPPSNSDFVIDWFSNMFRYKEERIIFIPGQLEEYLKSAGFSQIKSFFFFMPNFSINNWIENSGLPEEKINDIIRMHIDAPQEVKEAHNMRIKGENVLINSKYTIVVGEKNGK